MEKTLSSLVIVVVASAIYMSSLLLYFLVVIWVNGYAWFWVAEPCTPVLAVEIVSYTCFVVLAVYVLIRLLREHYMRTGFESR